MMSAWDGSSEFIDERTHFGTERMRLWQEVIRCLTNVKRGSTFRTHAIHVSHDFIDKLIKDVYDYAIIERRHANKKYRCVISSEQLFDDSYERNPVMNHILIEQKHVVIYLCETFPLLGIIAPNWHLVCRVSDGQPVNGRPTTRILEGILGSYKLEYNYGTESLVMSGACTTQIPLVDAVDIRKTLGYSKK